MKPDVERLLDMAYASGETPCTVHGTQLEVSVAGAVRQRCGHELWAIWAATSKRWNLEFEPFAHGIWTCTHLVHCHEHTVNRTQDWPTRLTWPSQTENIEPIPEEENVLFFVAVTSSFLMRDLPTKILQIPTTYPWFATNFILDGRTSNLFYLSNVLLHCF